GRGRAQAWAHRARAGCGGGRATWAGGGWVAHVDAALGVAHDAGAARALGAPGSGSPPAPPDGCRPPTACLPLPRNACASRPEAGARGGQAARRARGGGGLGNRHPYRDPHPSLVDFGGLLLMVAKNQNTIFLV